MTHPSDTLRGLVEALESAVDNIFAAECIYGVLSQESGIARDQRDTARAALLTHGAAVEQDAERLNWLEKQVDPLHLEQDWKGGEYTMQKSATLYLFKADHKAPTIREAIDAAIEATRPTEARDA